MGAHVAGFGISRDHTLDDRPFQKHKSSAAIDGGGKAALGLTIFSGAKRANVKERRAGKGLLRSSRPFDRRAAPVDHFEWIAPADEFVVEAQHVKNLLGLEANVGVDEQEMGGLCLQKLAHQRIAAAGDQRVMPKHRKGDVEIGIWGKLDE